MRFLSQGLQLLCGIEFFSLRFLFYFSAIGLYMYVFLVLTGTKAHQMKFYINLQTVRTFWETCTRTNECQLLWHQTLHFSNFLNSVTHLTFPFACVSTPSSLNINIGLGKDGMQCRADVVANIKSQRRTMTSLRCFQFRPARLALPSLPPVVHLTQQTLYLHAVVGWYRSLSTSHQ